MKEKSNGARSVADNGANADITVRNVFVKYPGAPRHAVSGVSFDIKRGEVVTLLGPNGSGKTTLLYTILGTLAPVQGSVKAGKKSLTRMTPRERARRISYLPQVIDTSVEYTVFDVVLMGRNPHIDSLSTYSKADCDIAIAAMRQCRVESLKERAINMLSGGERQRCHLARAICQGAQTILLDEPTAHLDISAQSDMISYINELREKKETSILVTTHDLQLATEISDRVILLRGGKIISQGTPADTLTQQNIRATFSIGTEIATTDSGRKFLVPTPRHIQRTRALSS